MLQYMHHQVCVNFVNDVFDTLIHPYLDPSRPRTCSHKHVAVASDSSMSKSANGFLMRLQQHEAAYQQHNLTGRCCLFTDQPGSVLNTKHNCVFGISPNMYISARINSSSVLNLIEH